MTDFSFASRIGDQELQVLKTFTNTAPVKVGALAKALGLDVVLATLPMNISGSIQPSGNGGFVIRVNRFESKERQRFTIAHEIAHYLLHKDHINAGIVDSVLYRSKLPSKIEAEANKLAADIVMPSRLITAELAEMLDSADERSIVKLAEKFEVSKQAMGIRVS